MTSSSLVISNCDVVCVRRLDIVKADFERKLEDHSKRLFGAASTARKLGEGNPWVIKRLFHDFDPDGSNCVDITEFTKLVREHFALKFSDADIQALFNFYDIGILQFLILVSMC